MSRLTLADLNARSTDELVERLGHLFEHSPWVVEEALAMRPFASVAAFHIACLRALTTAGPAAIETLLRAHPDLVGRAAEAGTLTASSTAEQRAAGLDADALTDTEREAFRVNNAAYRERFGFPFVICARENRKDAILAGFAERMENPRGVEVMRAMQEIGKIAWYRLADVVDVDGA
jgi:OHCU decarboxylase